MLEGPWADRGRRRKKPPGSPKGRELLRLSRLSRYLMMGSSLADLAGSDRPHSATHAITQGGVCRTAAHSCTY